MSEEDYKRKADIAIYGMQRLIETLEDMLKKWLDSQYADTDIGQDMIQTLEEQIKEAKAEKEAYEQYKVTGVFIARQARKLLQDKQKHKLENDKDEEER